MSPGPRSSPGSWAELARHLRAALGPELTRRETGLAELDEALRRAELAPRSRDLSEARGIELTMDELRTQRDDLQDLAGALDAVLDWLPDEDAPRPRGSDSPSPTEAES